MKPLQRFKLGSWWLIGLVAAISVLPGRAAGTSPARQEMSCVATMTDLAAVQTGPQNDGLLVQVGAFSTPGDGGGGVFRYAAAAQARACPGMAVSPASGEGRWLRQYSGRVNLRWLGAKGDGVADDSAAFRAASELADALVSPSPLGESDPVGGASFFIPAGTYLITQDNAFMQSKPGARAHGLEIVGEGAAVTRIKFRPATAGAQLLLNDDKWKYVRIAGMDISCMDPTAVLLNLHSDGGADGFTFEDVHVSGTWRRAFWLHGTNTGSEMKFVRCSFIGAYQDAVLYIGADANDQFVNYFFQDCNVGLTDGDFIYAYAGGSINVSGGSWSCYDARKRSGWYFDFPTGDHASGSSRLLVSGLRIEYRKSGLMGLINCAWKQGNILFQNVQDDINASAGQPAGQVTANFKFSNAAGCEVAFRDCALAGRHTYAVNGLNGAHAPQQIIYDGCRFPTAERPQDFVLTPRTAKDSAVGVKFINCAGKYELTGKLPGNSYLWNCTLNWPICPSVSPVRRVAVFVDGEHGTMPVPGNPVTILLPLDSLVTRISFCKQPGGTSATKDFSYFVRTGEGVPTELARFGGTEPWRLGFTKAVDLGFMCDTPAKCRLSLEALGITEKAPAGWVVVDYLN